MLLLFETAAGYALFKVKEGKLDNVEVGLQSVAHQLWPGKH
jgi:hypothetical protein